MYKTLVITPLGDMVAIANDNGLVLLQFLDSEGIESSRAKALLRGSQICSDHPILKLIDQEIRNYFNGIDDPFTTPIDMLGTDFQKTVWRALRAIPYGELRSYADIAKAIDRPKAFRAVARANATNPLALIVPCHRVVNSDGSIGGYAGHVSRKKYLLQREEHEMYGLA